MKERKVDRINIKLGEKGIAWLIVNGVKKGTEGCLFLDRWFSGKYPKKIIVTIVK